jgi:hypothetical protein
MIFLPERDRDSPNLPGSLIQMLPSETRELLSEINPEALLADGFDALVGVCYRFGQPPLAAYDYEKCIQILMKDCSEEESIEYFEYNTLGAWMGENTPVFLKL